jgi:hypothetical protein
MMTKTTLWTVTVIVSLALTSAAFAATDEEKCQQALSIAAGKYQLCMNNEFGKYYGGRVSLIKLRETRGKCVDKYTQTWTKLVKKFTGKGTSCEGARYVENGDGTFYDGLTRLTWEEKTDDGSIHDRGDFYTWSTGSPWKEDGTAFTVFLKALNDAGFGGSNGWRLPSEYELYTLVEPVYPNCTTSPCTTAPGETLAGFYWSSSALAVGPSLAWVVGFSAGNVGIFVDKSLGFYVRAVRGGS